MSHALTIAAYIFHVGAGMIALESGTAALIARKGGHLHRRAGRVFVVAMLVMAIFASYLAVVVPDQLVNLFIAIFVLCLLATAWMTVHRKAATTGLFENGALFIGLCLFAPFAILSFQLAAGLTPLFKSAVAFRGPVLIAIHTFTAVLAMAAFGDARVVLFGGISGTPRIARHLWRMCLALTLAYRIGFYQRICALPARPLPCAANLFLSAVPTVGVVVLLDDPRALYGVARAPQSC